ncbi:hypothetical protein THAOC_27676, partial [Thalassiosira oceanica]
DVRKGVELYTEAAELGSIEALFSLGCAHERGVGVEQDEIKAAVFYNKAAMQGHALCRHKLGVHEAKKGNHDRAVRHWLISAKMGFEASLEAIKNTFKAGFATKEQYAEALKGYQDAVEEMKTLAKRSTAAPCPAELGHCRSQAHRLQNYLPSPAQRGAGSLVRGALQKERATGPDGCQDDVDETESRDRDEAKAFMDNRKHGRKEGSSCNRLESPPDDAPEPSPALLVHVAGNRAAAASDPLKSTGRTSVIWDMFLVDSSEADSSITRPLRIVEHHGRDLPPVRPGIQHGLEHEGGGRDGRRRGHRLRTDCVELFNHPSQDGMDHVSNDKE